MIRAAIYARISSDREGDQLGVRRQVEDCERLLARKGWEVAERYVDDDVSAYNGRRAARVSADARRPPRRLPRRGGGLAPRSPASAAARAGGVLRPVRSRRRASSWPRSAATSTSRPTTASSWLVSSGRWRGRRATTRAAGSRRKHEELAQAGRIAGGGTRPFGFEADRRTIRESEAAVIRECARRGCSPARRCARSAST